MVRQAMRGAVGGLLAALLAGCLGGQTGQPSSLECERDKLSSSAVWEGTTVGAAANAFAGTYEGPLLWQEEPRSASTHTAVDLQDSLQLTIAYDGASATRDGCTHALSVPVTVTLTSSGSGIAESGQATLAITGSKGALGGSLTYQSERLVLHAGGREVAAGGALAGELDSLVEGLPGASASFDVEP